MTQDDEPQDKPAQTIAQAGVAEATASSPQDEPQEPDPVDRTEYHQARLAARAASREPEE